MQLFRRKPTFMVNSGAAAAPMRVNLRAAVNAADIRTEMYNGREHLVLPSYTLPDNVVMNGGLYPADEIEKSYKSLEDTPAPVGHPQIDGEYVSAYHPAAINGYYAGAFNRNVRRDGHRIYLEKWVDTEFAKTNAQGQALLAAIADKQPIHTSTGVLLEPEPVTNAALGYKWIARNMRFDHDAILINETGAATPEQGVGLFVNVEDAEPVVEPEEQGIIKKILNMLRGDVVSEPAIQPNSEALDMTPEELQALLDAQAEKQKEAIVSAVNTAVAPLQEQLTAVTQANEALAAKLKANTDAEEAGMRAAVAAEYGEQGELVANALTGDALKAAYAKCAKAAPLVGGFKPNSRDTDGLDNTLPE